VPGLHPAAWDAATCAAITRELERRAVVRGSIAHYGKGLLTGVLRCGYCGALMTGSVVWTRNKRQAHTYYRCWAIYNQRRQGGAFAPGLPHAPNTISEEAALALIDDLRRGAQIPPPRLPEGRRATPPSDSLLVAARAELESARPGSRARTLLAADVATLEREYAEAVAEFARHRPAPEQSPAERAARLAAVQAVDLHGPDQEAVRATLLDAYEAIYLIDKAVVGPPEFG
jgi:hypothetical protein